MKNHKWEARCVYFDLMDTRRVCWLEVDTHTIGGKTITHSQECQTDETRRGHFTAYDGMNFMCSGIYSEEYRCLDLSKCQTLAACKRALQRYYDAINATPDKYPGQMV